MPQFSPIRRAFLLNTFLNLHVNEEQGLIQLFVYPHWKYKNGVTQSVGP